MTADPVRKTYWVYTDQSLFELVVTNEHRDVWKIYLEKGKFDLALQYTTVRLHHCLSSLLTDFRVRQQHSVITSCRRRRRHSSTKVDIFSRRSATLSAL